MIEITTFEQEVKDEPNGNKELLKHLNVTDEVLIYIVLFYEYNYSELLKAFLSRQDALDYKRYYELHNYRKCIIKELLLE